MSPMASPQNGFDKDSIGDRLWDVRVDHLARRCFICKDLLHFDGLENGIAWDELILLFKQERGPYKALGTRRRSGRRARLDVWQILIIARE